MCRKSRKFPKPLFSIINVILGCFVKTDPVRNMQSETHVPPLSYFWQDRHWSGPGPQQPSEEQRGSHTWPSLTVETNVLFHHQFNTDMTV